MKSLCKLFYADPQAYAAAYEKRFHDPDTVHLDLCIGENPAFFCQTTDLYRRMLSVERTNNADKIRKLPESTDAFVSLTVLRKLLDSGII